MQEKNNVSSIVIFCILFQLFQLFSQIIESNNAPW
jgi:hypothetical protein